MESRKIRILAIDDNQDNLISLKALLNEAFPAADFFTALNGENGLELAVTKSPDIILLDILMPEMDGYEVCERLKKKGSTKHIPVLMLTATKTDTESRVRGLNMGADAFISKPIDHTELMAQMNVVLRMKSAEDKLRAEKENLEKLVSERTDKLKESEENYKALYENAPLPFQSLDDDGYFKDVNPAWLQMLGYEQDDVIGKWFGDFLHPDGKSLFIKNFPEIKQRGYGLDIRMKIRHKEGHYLDISYESRIGYHPDGSFKQTYCVFQDITEKKHAEAILKEGEDRLKKILDSSPFPIVIVDVNDQTILHWSISAKKLFGHDPKTSQEWYELAYPDPNYRNEAMERGKRIFKVAEKSSKAVNAGEYHIVCKDGSTKICELYVQYIHKNLIITTNDITKRKQAEEQIIQERRMLRALIDNIPDFIYIKDIAGRKVISNNADVKNIGFKKEEDVLGKTDLELFPGTIGERGYADDMKVINSGKPKLEQEEDFVGENGERRWILTSKIPLHDKDGKVTGLVGVGHDITKRKQIKDELHQSYMFNDSLLRTIPFGMDIVDEEGRILFQSDTFKKLFGKNNIGEKCWKIYRDDKTQCTDCPLISGLKIGETETYESHGILGNRIFEINHTGMMYQGKRAMLEIFQDITHRKEHERELTEAKEKAEESDRLKTAFLHNISHEIRTPLNGITGFSDIITNPDLSTEKKKHYAQLIHESSDQLISIVSDIISMATIEANQEKLHESETDLTILLQLLKDQYIRKVENKNLSLTVTSTIGDEEKIVLTDKTKLLQILSNLISNAIKYTLEGHIKVNGSLDGRFIKFTVEDTGIGIPSEMHEKIFDRFFQIDNSDVRSYGGNGLGLSIVKSYVNFLNGKIGLNSQVGKGSEFSISIPYKSVKQSTPVNIPENEYSMLTEYSTILIAEDEDLNFLLLEEIFSDLEINIIRAKNGVEAIDICKQNDSIDLILMDLKMPVINGYEATKQIRKFRPELPIIVQTAYSTDFDKDRAKKCGCDDFISKPYKQEMLFSMMNEQLSKKDKNK